MKELLSVVLCGFAAISILPTQAFSDEGGSLKDSPMIVAEPTWSGFYFGGSVGYGRNRSENNYYDSTGASSSVSESAEGGLISGVIGYDRQIGRRFILGAFVDFDISDLDRGDASRRNALTITRSWAVGGRLGYLVSPDMMIFGTGGYTQAHFRNEGWWDILANGVGPNLPGENAVNFSGYFVGGGFERKLRSGFYLRGEGRYADYSAETTNAGNFGGTDYVDREDPEIFTGRIGITYKFGRNYVPPLTEESLKDDYYDGGHAYKVVTINGADISKDAWALYSYNLFALNGNFERDGLLFRTLSIYSNFSYDDGAVPATEYDVDDRSVDALIGYQKHFEYFTAAAYVGYEIRDVDISPDDRSNAVRGTKSGFKAALELETKDGSAVFAAVDGSYSTAFDTFTADARIGHNAGSFIVGPEGSIYDDDSDSLYRVGAFASVPFSLNATTAAEITFNGGYQFVDESGAANNSSRGGDGGYGAVAFKLAY